MENTRDRFWLWGHEPGSLNEDWELPAPSRMTPVEAAYYMGIPNVIMIRANPEPLLPDLQYTVPFRTLREVVWSVVGAGGRHTPEETERVLEIPETLPNMTGVMMDDFFRKAESTDEAGTLSIDRLHSLRKRLARPDRDLDLWVVLYDHQLHLPVREHLRLCEKVTFWTWEAPNLENLERNFSIVEDLTPACGKYLGCYMWDFGRKLPMPVETMERQCELGLRWLREGRIEGMIFLASGICDLDLETVEWTRRWIAEVG